MPINFSGAKLSSKPIKAYKAEGPKIYAIKNFGSWRLGSCYGTSLLFSSLESIKKGEEKINFLNFSRYGNTFFDAFSLAFLGHKSSKQSWEEDLQLLSDEALKNPFFSMTFNPSQRGKSIFEKRKSSPELEALSLSPCFSKGLEERLKKAGIFWLAWEPLEEPKALELSLPLESVAEGFEKALALPSEPQEKEELLGALAGLLA